MCPIPLGKDSPDRSVVAYLRNSFGRAAYTHKTHEKEAEGKFLLARWMKITNVVVITVTAGSAIISPLLESSAIAWVAATSALIALCFAVFQLSFDPASDAAQQKAAARSYLSLRDSYRQLLAHATVLDSTELLHTIRILDARFEALDSLAPPTTGKAYEKARKALRGTEELTFSNDEYSHLLEQNNVDFDAQSSDD